MAGKPQVTAKIGADASGVNKTLAGVKRSFGGFARDLGRAMKGAAIAGMAGAAAGVAAALKNGFDQKVMLEQSETLMKSLLGGADKAASAMKMLGDEAKENPIFGKKQMVEAGAALANFADGSVDKLQGLVETSQLLSVLNPAQGLEGAAYALKEALGGDYVSLAERFNISKSTIRSMKEAGLEGKKLVDAILKQQGVTQDTLGNMSNTMGGQMAKVKGMWDAISLQLVEGFWPRIQETATEFMGWLMTNKDQIIGIMTTATEVAIKMFQWAVGAITWIKNGVAELGAFFGGWWAHISATFSLENFMKWLGNMAASATTLLTGFILKLIGLAAEKLREFAPTLFKVMGGEGMLAGVNKAAGENFAASEKFKEKNAELMGVNAGREQVATLRIDAQGQQLPRMMAAG